MNDTTKARIYVITSMVIYGSIGLFVRNISLPSAVISMVRGLIGAPFLLLVLAIKKKRLNLSAIKANIKYLLSAGVLLGVNWILLFEAYRYTTVAVATLCYYTAPIIIVMLSPLMFSEKLTVKKLACILIAVVGMALISGIFAGEAVKLSELKGIFLALGAAVLYAGILIINKKSGQIPPFDRTIIQLVVSALVLMPYCLINYGGSFACSGKELVLLLILGIGHTGLAYLLYFGSMDKLPSQSLAILSYIDPAVAVLVSALILGETMGAVDMLGAVLIIGAALVSEMPQKNDKKPG